MAVNWKKQSSTTFNNAFNSKNAMGSIGGTLGAVGNIINAGLDNAKLADTSSLDEQIAQSQSHIVGAKNNDDLMNEWSMFSPINNVSWRDIRGGSTGQRIGNTLSGTVSGISAGAKIGGPIGGVIGGVVGLGTSIAGWLTGNAKAREKAREYNRNINNVNTKNLFALSDKASSIDMDNDLRLMNNYMAYGGLLNGFNTAALNYDLAKEDLGIKALNAYNKSKFTSMPNSFEFPKVNTFKDGGALSEWNHDIKIINNGGTHEENPMQGVPIGISDNGKPNLVEEGEVVFKDYVFSNRLKASKKLLEDTYLPTSYKDISFAEIAKKFIKEAEERPNDPIYKKGLESNMLKLQQAQETIKQQNNTIPQGNLFSGGGDTHPYMARSAAKRAGFKVGESLTDYTTNPVPQQDDLDASSPDLSWLRYAPVLGNVIGVGQGLLSKPDYSSPNAVLEAAYQAGDFTPISYTPVGNYLQYKPLDRSYGINKLNAQANAVRRSIMNSTNPSRNAALLAADYNTLGKIGDFYRQAEEYNAAQRQQVEAFNRATNQYNSEMGLKTAMANLNASQSAKAQKLSGVQQAMAMREAIDAAKSAALNANMSNLFESLGNIGIDSQNRQDRDFYIKNTMGANLPLKEFERLFGKEATKLEAKRRGIDYN